MWVGGCAHEEAWTGNPEAGKLWGGQRVGNLQPGSASRGNMCHYEQSLSREGSACMFNWNFRGPKGVLTWQQLTVLGFFVEGGMLRIEPRGALPLSYFRSRPPFYFETGSH